MQRLTRKPTLWVFCSACYHYQVVLTDGARVVVFQMLIEQSGSNKAQKPDYIYDVDCFQYHTWKPCSCLGKSFLKQARGFEGKQQESVVAAMSTEVPCFLPRATSVSFSHN